MKKKTYSRVIIEKSGERRRLCSFNVNLNSGDLFIHFKMPLTVIAQGTLDTRVGTLVREDPEVPKIEHVHYINSKHKIVVTYREKGGKAMHTRGVIFIPRKVNGRYLHLITRILPRDSELLKQDKQLTGLDFTLHVPIDAINERIGYDLWFGSGFDQVQVAQASHYIRLRYEKYESKFLECAFGNNGPYSVYVVMYLPKNKNWPEATRIIIPRSIKNN